MEALKVDNLAKSFGGVQVLRNISFNIGIGEKLAIIGPNGAGKTTLFNILNGQILPTAGRIFLFNQDVTGTHTYRCARYGRGRSFQITSLFPNLTVFENVLLAVQGTSASCWQLFRSITANKRLCGKAQELLERMAMWDKKDEEVHALGYGEQRKLEIILSIASEPRLLLLDEPNAGLNATESAEIITMIHNLLKDLTVVLIAHDMDLVFGLAEKILVLNYGEIVTLGTPAEIKTDSRVKEIYMGIKEDTQNVGAS